MTTTHSPLPWHVTKNGEGILDAEKFFVCELFPDVDQTKLDAALIVRAVNNHAALVAALELIDPDALDGIALDLDYYALYNTSRTLRLMAATAREALKNAAT